MLNGVPTEKIFARHFGFPSIVRRLLSAGNKERALKSHDTFS